MDPQELLVADVMTIDPIVIHADASLEDATVLIQANGISGLPVIDDSGLLVGVISQTDLIAETTSTISRLIRTHPSGLRVCELMTSPAVTVPMTGSLIEAARVMLDSHVHRVVAVDDVGHPVGILSATDFVTLYAQA